MRERLARFLLEVHDLLSDPERERRTPLGAGFERDVENLAAALYLPTERRVRTAPFGGVYFSGLRPETDLFVYDGPEFIQMELKDLATPVTRLAATELWARALDLHLGRASNTLASGRGSHYVALVAAGGADHRLRMACLRWGILLIEPRWVPIGILSRVGLNVEALMREAGVPAADFAYACLPFNQRFPIAGDGIVLPLRNFRRRNAVEGLFRLQRAANNLKNRLALTDRSIRPIGMFET